jgi:hypothetical protein
VDFASSIAQQQGLSQKQAFWVDKIIAEVCNTPVAAPVQNHDFAAVFNMFLTAQKHLKYPKVQLDSPVGRVKLSIASKNAKFPGSISIVTGRQGFVGRIHTDGRIDINRQGESIKTEITDFLVEFSQDPVKMSVEQGKLHSRCCFCALPLKTQESLAVGYGDVCAKHWGLPWGKKKITDPQILEFTPVAEVA